MLRLFEFAVLQAETQVSLQTTRLVPLHYLNGDYALYPWAVSITSSGEQTSTNYFNLFAFLRCFYCG